jgi:hypothetical protein
MKTTILVLSVFSFFVFLYMLLIELPTCYRKDIRKKNRGIAITSLFIWFLTFISWFFI